MDRCVREEINENLLMLHVVCYINVRKKQKGQSQMKKKKRNWQRWVHKAQDEDKQNKTHSTICIGDHYP